MLAVSRFLLGLGEGGGFPAATRAVAEWFPARERSTAMGIVNAGTAVGGVVAPPLIALVLHGRLASGVLRCGALGLLWTAWWRRAYFVPMRHPRLGGRAACCVEAQSSTPTPGRRPVAGSACSASPDMGPGHREVPQRRAPGTSISFWLPKYLYDARGFDIKAVGRFAWIPMRRPASAASSAVAIELAATRQSLDRRGRSRLARAPR